MHTKQMGITSKVVNGILHLSSDTDLDGCDIWFTCKMKINSSGHGNTRINALKVNKVLILDWGFMMQKCNDKEMTDRLTGMNRDQAWIFIA